MEKIKNEVRKNILTGLKDGDKTQTELREHAGIDYDNRSKVHHHLQVLQGKSNGTFKGNPLIKEYREDGQKLYTTLTGKIKYKYNMDYFLPYIYLMFFQAVVSVGLFYEIGYQMFLGWIGSTFTSTLIISMWLLREEDIRQVYYTDDIEETEEEEQGNMSIEEIAAKVQK